MVTQIQQCFHLVKNFCFLRSHLWEFLHDNSKGILPLDVEPLFQAPWEGVCTVISIRSHGKVQSNKIPLILECHQIRSHGCAVVKALVFLAAF